METGGKTLKKLILGIWMWVGVKIGFKDCVTAPKMSPSFPETPLFLPPPVSVFPSLSPPSDAWTRRRPRWFDAEGPSCERPRPFYVSRPPSPKKHFSKLFQIGF